MKKVPTIDLALFKAGQFTDNDYVQLTDACQDMGFFLLKGHGLDELVAEVFSESKQFFSEDKAYKLSVLRDDESISTCLDLARLEGIFVGISAGATVNAALKVAQKAKKGSVLLAMLPDTAERYLSTPLFTDINEESDDDWLNNL
ncbi:hypothetical protein OAL14_07395 [Gammaproteobacteria bacterium]|nr:hypothetical protein [Gammaproteobacteria bacterium]